MYGIKERTFALYCTVLYCTMQANFFLAPAPSFFSQAAPAALFFSSSGSGSGSKGPKYIRLLKAPAIN